MTILIIIVTLLAIIIALVGILGAILPAIPGPPLSFASLFLVYLVYPNSISIQLLLIMLGVTILVTALDYIAPIITTKLGGGSRHAMWGVTIGIIAGLFYMPLGLLLGPFIGAFVGEYISNKKIGHSLKVAALSFVSFLLTTGFKLVATLVMTYYTLLPIYRYVYDYGKQLFD